MRRLGIRITNIVLFVVCCYAVAGLVNTISGEVLSPRDEAPSLAAVEAPRQAPRSAARVADINRRNLFGSSQTVSADLPEPEPEPEPATLTKLPLRLVGTAAFAEHRELSRAAIAGRGSKDAEILAIGDSLSELNHPSVEVAAISAREVVLDNRGSREILRLDDEDGQKVRKKPSRSRKPRRTARPSSRRTRERASPRTSRSSSAGTSKLVNNLRELAGQAAPNAGLTKLLTQAQILPKYEAGQMVGIEVSAIEDGSIYEQIGLNDGDVISQVNGSAIDSPTATPEIIARLLDGDDIEMTVNGQTVTVSAAKIKELMDSGVLDP